jgi:prevent-host-death family protein
MTHLFITTAEAKETFFDLINQVSHDKERIILTRRGKEIAAIIPLEDLQLIENLQNKSDLQAAIDSLKETREQGSISLEELKKDIGGLP